MQDIGRNGSRCCINRQYILLFSVNFLLLYTLYEAHNQVKISRDRLTFLDSFQVLHIQEPPGLDVQVGNMFDGIPLKRRVLNIADVQSTTISPFNRTTTAPDLRRPINCTKILLKDADEIRRIAKIKISAFDTYQDRSPREFIQMTQDCASFRTTLGYRNKALSKEEEDFPIAFGIRMHWKVAMVERLLRAIYHPQNVYCIYIDKKSSQEIHRAMRGIAKCLPNVGLATHTDFYIYGSITAVWGDLQCMRDTINTRVRWKYYINLAGQEYPLKTNLELVRMLKLLNGTNDIESYPLPRQFNHRIQYHHQMANGIWSVNYRMKKQPFVYPNYPNITFRKGCSYNTFSRAFVNWTLNDPFPQAFISWANDTDSPDEMVWATLNSLPEAPGGYPIYITQIAKTFLSREIVWQWGSGYCQGKLIRHICIFSYKDFAWLAKRWEFFANKFDPQYDHFILDCLDTMLQKRETEADPTSSLDWERLQNLPHIKYNGSYPNYE